MAFKKGQSGNPGGRPKELHGIQALAREHADLAIKVLADVAKRGKSEAARVAAATALLDRGFGKPSQTPEHYGEAALSLSELVIASYEKGKAAKEG